MGNPLQVNRRRVLELSTVGTGLAIAGCADQLSSDEFEGDHGDLEENERRVTMQVNFQQEGLEDEFQELQQLQQQLQQLQMQAAEDEEAAEQLEELEEELEELVDEITETAFQTVLDDFQELDLTIEDRLEEQGLLKVAGEVTELIDATTETDSIQSLASSSLFDETEEELQQEPEEPIEPQ